MKRQPLFNCWTALVMMGAAPGLHAQAASPATTNKPNDQVIALPAFEVTASSDGRHAASDSLTASRVHTHIKNLPYNVNVVTSITRKLEACTNRIYRSDVRKLIPGRNPHKSSRYLYETVIGGD